MFSADLKAAFRNIFRKKITALISILGLGIGLGCIIILLALITHELSFDRFIPDHRNVYRVAFGQNGLTSYPLGENMAQEFPEVDGYFRYYRAMTIQIKTSDNTIIRENNFSFADTSIFRITGVRLISGRPAYAPNEVAISKDAAKKLFGSTSPESLMVPVKLGDGFTPMAVTGVFENFPSTSTLNPSFIADIRMSEMMFSNWQRSLGDFGSDQRSPLDWTKTDFLTYLKLVPGSNTSALVSRMDKYREFSLRENKNELHYMLQPVANIYLNPEEVNSNQYLRQGNRSELIYYEVISVMILLISVANYVLLTRAGVSDRMLNLGTRKAYGATSGKIRQLIIMEATLIVLISLIPAVFIFEWGMELVNSTLNKTLSSDIFLNPALWGLLVIVVLLTGTFAGWLIGYHYSNIPALSLISGSGSKGRRGPFTYSFLVFHFIIYIVFAAGLIAVSKQIKYSRTGFRGIDPRNILVSNLTSESLMKSFSTIKNEMDRVPGVISIAGGTFIPPFGNFLPVTLATAEGSKVRFDGLIMGEGMTELLGIEVSDGASFGPYKAGTPDVLINESTARDHKVKAGEKLLAFNVVGVVKDFHAHSLHSEIQPMVILQQNPERMSLVAIKTDGTNDAVIREKLRQLYRTISPDEIFEARYLTDRIDNFYSRELNQAKLIGAFAVLAAVLSAMGLFGISVISISGRRKEIGLRKVNGAAIREVLLMVNADFLKWVLVAFILAVPISLYLVNKWLERFAYKTELNWWIFAAAGFSAVFIAILTVSWQSLRAAKSNPAEAIRHE